MISILDSGVGGACFKLAMPFDCHLVCDSKHFPYGKKDLDWLKNHFVKLIDEINSEIIIVACNTLSSLIFYYQIDFNKQVVDVITPTIFYLRKHYFPNILILATTNTIKMNVYEKLLRRKIDYLDVSELISAIELNDYQDELLKVIALVNKGYEAIVLGCTHLIKVKAEFRQALRATIISQDELVYELFTN